MTWIQFLAGAGIFSSCHCIQTSYAGHPASYPMDNGGTSPWVIQLRYIADHSLSSTTKVKNMWSYTSTFPSS